MAFVFSVASVLLVSFIVLGQQSRAGLRPFMVINRTDYQVDYYELSVGEPTLIIRGMYDGSPVPITVSLFAFTPGKLYVVGYYYGDGAVSINLTGNLITHVANRWLGRYGEALWPSLIAFITYTSGNRSWTAITVIPYDPSWIAARKPISIAATVEFSRVKPILIKPLGTGEDPNVNPTTITSPGGGEEYFGYMYMGSCLGNSVVESAANQLTENYGSNVAIWEPVECEELEGPIPLIFVGWSQNAIQNSIQFISITDFSGTAQKGSGLYGVVNITYPEASPPTSQLSLVGPTITFNSNYNLQVEYASFVGGYVNNEGGVGDVVIEYGSSTSSTLSGTALTYTVPSQGFVYLGLYGNISYVSFEEYVYGQPINAWANGTMPLSISPSEISGDALFIYPGLDTGNGPITGMFTAILYDYQTTGQLPISLLDGYSYPVNQQCSNAPPATQTGSNQISYTLSAVTNTYSPNPIGWAYLAGSLVAGIFLTYLPLWLQITAGSAITILGVFIPTNLFYNNQFALQATVYINYYASSTKSFYVTLLGTQQASNAQGLYPMGMIINETKYYLGIQSCQS
ncbi:hypothetical protein [Vulcanisaeta sp. JCM 16161]|uniref:hypothetical protein n=1 Tax=Vulcanisaeta sp. JCM 16161 TaxID=1295372 RepID=UPI00406CE134